VVRVVDRDVPEVDAVEAAAVMVRGGGLVIYPTETFYGIAADPVNGAAVERLFDAKGREKGKPIPLVASDMDAVMRAVSAWPPFAAKLAEVYWPGPLTLVLPASEAMHPLVHAGTGKVGVRISPHPVARRLAAAAGGLITATSANLSGDPPASAVEGLSERLVSLVDMVLDSGRLSGGLPSTVVDLSSVEPRLLRDGCVPWGEVLRAMAYA
jgi:L-threonylcarbamoyladenylate synthase